MVRVRVLIYQGSGMARPGNTLEDHRHREWIAPDRPQQLSHGRYECPFEGVYQQDASRADLLRHTAAQLLALADLDDASLATGLLEEKETL